MICLNFKQDEKHKVLNQQQHFAVPAGVSSISFQVEEQPNMWLTCMVYDEKQQLRGQYMNITKQPFVIHEDPEKTSPNTVYGTIHEGQWTVDIGIFAKEEVEASAKWCTLSISFNELDTVLQPNAYHWQTPDQAVFDLQAFQSNKVIQERSKWYKGDFHTHTIYSDGKMTREENMESANNQGLDFFVATDHNIVPTSWFAETDILVIPGVEVTSPLGHYNIIDTKKSPFSDNRMHDLLSEEGMNRIIHDDYGDALTSVNHPFLTEWKWLLQETPLLSIDSIEICNDPTYPDNEHATNLALQAWSILLNDGYRITGIGGSDSHMKPEETYEGSTEPSLIGDPGTFVYGNELSAKEIVRQIRQGHVVVSRGEFIDFCAGEYMAGDTCERRSGKAMAQVLTDEAIYFEWILDGEVVHTEYGTESSYEFQLDNDYHWLRVDVRYIDGTFYGFTNPLYFGEKPTTMTKWGELLQRMKESNS
ncbi:CehA/McbA family metallohydrolase [Pontibacillus litoralis]|uniref:Polymerase/histidinol phosphatase N-terminal domain-containing protein n=1 Tax=Pontibacillus litoralis JSM 072002 TaxID=1385512 RepID=A0A0A5G7K6_9BACI|nr:CehA/McbA family metallohydrolase [Pontibacillus litoralis]KGX87075.1 hypothetical protein N784_02445 [Pontibacillus litoralis JSM 072002]